MIVSTFVATLSTCMSNRFEGDSYPPLISFMSAKTVTVRCRPKTDFPVRKLCLALAFVSFRGRVGAGPCTSPQELVRRKPFIIDMGFR